MIREGKIEKIGFVKLQRYNTVWASWKTASSPPHSRDSRTSHRTNETRSRVRTNTIVAIVQKILTGGRRKTDVGNASENGCFLKKWKQCAQGLEQDLYSRKEKFVPDGANLMHYQWQKHPSDAMKNTTSEQFRGMSQIIWIFLNFMCRSASI